MNYNISYEIAGVIFSIILIVILLTNYQVKSKANIRFRWFAVSVFFDTLFDVITAVTIIHSNSIPLAINYVLNIIYFLLGIVSALFAFLYLEEAYHNKTPKIFKNIVLVFYLIYLIVTITTPITKWLFYFDENLIYQHGILHTVSYIAPLITTIACFFIILHNRKNFPLKHRLFNYSFVFVSIVAPIIQMFIGNVLLTGFAAVVVCFLMMFTLETPDYIQLEYLKNNLENEVEEKTKDIQELSLQTIKALANAVDVKDTYTKGHSVRVAAYAKALALKCGYSDKEAEDLYYATILHDVGKIGIPNHILNKRDRLTDSEYEMIKSHALKGGQILDSVSNMPRAKYIATHHHERYDGKGYPDHIAGENIEKDARIVAICDSFDAMNSNRIYRSMLDLDVIKKELIKNEGLQFDPVMVPIFIDMIDSGEIAKIENELIE